MDFTDQSVNLGLGRQRKVFVDLLKDQNKALFNFFIVCQSDNELTLSGIAISLPCLFCGGHLVFLLCVARRPSLLEMMWTPGKY